MSQIAKGEPGIDRVGIAGIQKWPAPVHGAGRAIHGRARYRSFIEDYLILKEAVAVWLRVPLLLVPVKVNE